MSDEVRVQRIRGPFASQRTDEVTVHKRKVSRQVTRGQTMSQIQYSIARRPVRSHEVRRGYIAEETEVLLQSDHRGQTRSQYKRGRCPVRSHEVR